MLSLKHGQLNACSCGISVHAFNKVPRTMYRRREKKIKIKKKRRRGGGEVLRGKKKKWNSDHCIHISFFL